MQELFKIAGLILNISVLMQVFALGLGATWEEATHLFRHPRLLVNSILARNVAVPVIAILLIKAFPLHMAVIITIGVLAVTPVPPLLPTSQLKAGGRSHYVLGLLVSQAVLAVVLVPVTIQIMDWALGAHVHFGGLHVAKLMLQAVLAPLAAGMLAARFLPRLQHFAPRLLAVGSVLLIVGLVPLLLLAWKAFVTLAGNGTLLALAIFIAAGTLAGHLFGGPAAADRTTLAVATSARHPGVALAIAQANFPTQSTLIAGTLVIYLLLRLILDVPYMRWRRSAPAS